MNVNIAIVGGNLTRDPELRYLPNGNPVADFGVAVNKVWTTGDGEKREQVSFFNLTAFGKTAENISQYFRKGDPILVEGELKMESWDDKQTGQKRTAVKVIVNRFNFVGGKKQDDGGERRERQPAGRGNARGRSPIDNEDVPGKDDSFGGGPSDDDVPF